MNINKSNRMGGEALKQRERPRHTSGLSKMMQKLASLELI